MMTIRMHAMDPFTLMTVASGQSRGSNTQVAREGVPTLHDDETSRRGRGNACTRPEAVESPSDRLLNKTRRTPRT